MFSKIQADLGVYSTLGNHDYGDYAEWADESAKSANLEKMKVIHRELGWTLLLNTNQMLKHKF